MFASYFILTDFVNNQGEASVAEIKKNCHNCQMKGHVSGFVGDDFCQR